MWATARLADLAVVTWAVDEDALARRLPAGVDVHVPLVSVVAYRYEGLRVRPLPWPRVSCSQYHVRAYVRVGVDQGVWFLDTVQDSRWAALPRWLWGMPWRRGDVSVHRDGDRSVTARAGALDLVVTPDPAAIEPAEETVDPTIGWYGYAGRIRRFEVRPASAPAERAAVVVGDDHALSADGVVAPGRPLGAFVRTEMDIDIHLPPTLVV